MEVAEIGVVAIWVVCAAIPKVHARVGGLQIWTCRFGHVAAIHQQLQHASLCEILHNKTVQKHFMTVRNFVVVGGELPFQMGSLWQQYLV